MATHKSLCLSACTQLIMLHSFYVIHVTLPQGEVSVVHIEKTVYTKVLSKPIVHEVKGWHGNLKCIWPIIKMLHIRDLIRAHQVRDQWSSFNDLSHLSSPTIH